MSSSVEQFIREYHEGKSRSHLMSKLRYLSKNCSVDELKKLLESDIISDETTFDRIFFNRIGRNYAIISFIASTQLSLTENQIFWLSQSRIIQHDEYLRNFFESTYNTEVQLKRRTINDLIKYTRKNKLAVSSDTINRTMKIGVNYYGNEGHSGADSETQKWLDRYIDEWEYYTQWILEDLHRLFQEDEASLLLKAAEKRSVSWYKDTMIGFQFNSEPEKDENGEVVVFPIQSEHISDYYVYQVQYYKKVDSKQLTTDYIAYNGSDEVLLVNRDKNTGQFNIKGFGNSQGLWPEIAARYIRTSKDEHFEGFYDGRKISRETQYLNLSQVVEAFCSKIAETLCSFLGFYYEALGNIDATYKANEKLFNENLKLLKEYAVESEWNFVSYPAERPSAHPEDIAHYNAFVTAYNQHLNETVWQKYEKEHTLRKNTRKLEQISGVPSFPSKENHDQRDYEAIYKNIVSTFESIKSKVGTTSLTDSDQNKVRLADWLSRKSVQGGKAIKEYFDQLRVQGTYGVREYDQLDIPPEEAYAVWSELLSFLERKIEERPEPDWQNIPELRDTADIYAQYISIASEMIFEKSSQEYYDFRISFNTNTALLKAAPFEEEASEKEEISFTGFSIDKNRLSFNKNFALAFREEKGKIQFYLIFNLSQGIALKLNDEKESEFKAIGYKGSGSTQEAVIKSLSFKKKEGTCILPLSFGKRIGRRYFYNNFNTSSEFNDLAFLKELAVKFSNLRIMRERASQKDNPKYYAAIALERRFTHQTQEEYTYQNLIGMDMGENIPAVLAAVDKDTNEIQWSQALRPEMKQKLLDIQKRKDESQRQNGYVPKNLSNKISNITQTLLEDITIETLEKALEGQRGLVVTEDLSRGFGRGNQKGTYVWMRQYTKLNDTLGLKAADMGLIKGRNQDALYTPYGIFAKVPAGYTSKTSIQTGFILRSPGYWSVQDTIEGVDEIVAYDDLGTEVTLNLDQRTVRVIWKDHSVEKQFQGTAEELGHFYSSSSVGREKFEELVSSIFEDRKDTKKRRKHIVSFIFNFLNPRKTQEEYKDIFTGKSVNADVQGAINVARSYNWGTSKIYKNKVKNKQLSSSEKIQMYQDWYIENCIQGKEIPEWLFMR